MFIITDNPKLALGIDSDPLIIPSNGPLTALIAVLPLQVKSNPSHRHVTVISPSPSHGHVTVISPTPYRHLMVITILSLFVIIAISLAFSPIFSQPFLSLF